MYPDLPDQRMIVDGVDIAERYGLIMLDGYTLKPPEPKEYFVEVPGGNGSIDLSSALLGDVAFGDRVQTFPFKVIDPKENIERVKSRISNFLHGRDHDYTLSFDPGYTYHGRFKISSYSHKMYDVGLVADFNIEIKGKPFKMGPKKVIVDNPIGGKILTLECGRMPSRPSITLGSQTTIVYDNKEIKLGPGKWVLADVVLHEGDNEIYMNTLPIHKVTWGMFKTQGITCAQMKNKRLFEWYLSSDPTSDGKTRWYNVMNDKWSDHAHETWAMLQTGTNLDGTAKREATIEYEWGDL